MRNRRGRRIGRHAYGVGARREKGRNRTAGMNSSARASNQDGSNQCWDPHLQSTPSAVRLVVEDDGAGFDPLGTRDGGLGLSGMRERVALVDGVLRVESAHGKGTTLVAEVPVR